ncbi:MAG: flagellar hook protein FlgE [Defluviitaleaceae bacterium]|nr:flagellar hook protein FlgE [Defluviitaleaceae bacterium]
MMRSMFSGVSSLRVHQTRMDVIANNIANVNTVGFKSQRATFADAFYQRIQGASGPDATTGRAGTNPQQIGLGLNLASIDNIMTQGATQRTDRSMDVTLTGPGFLIVQDSGGTFFTRAGNIGRDFHNNLHINGMQLMGWSTRLDEATGRHVVDRSALQPLQLSGEKTNMPAEPTCLISIVGNLNITQLNDDNYVVRSMAIFDSLGNRYLVDVRFTYHPEFSEASPSPHGYWTFEFLTRRINIETGNLYTGTTAPAEGNAIRDVIPAFLEGDRDVPSFIGICLGLPYNDPPSTAAASIGAHSFNMVTSGTIAFNSRGEFIGMGPADGNEPIEFNTGATASSSIGPGVRQTHAIGARIFPIRGVAPAATFGTGDYGVPLPPSHYDPAAPANTLTSIGNLTLNFSELFQRGGENTTLRALTMTGQGPGTLDDISIGPDGTIMGRFSNGRTRVLGQIPLAFFQNPEGLERIGANLWVPTANSGPFDGVGLVGSMQGGSLEMSNVDLANEFTEMITTQRGFQAASRTITVSDEMLQELVNLRR